MPRLLVIADADSYLKWGARRAHEWLAVGDASVVVVESAVTPSPAQRAAALAGTDMTADVLPFKAVRALVHDLAPDAVLLACRGPLVDLLIAEALEDAPGRPVIAAGLPGLWFPPSQEGLTYRRDVDVMVVHSHRERDTVKEMTGLADARVGLASLVHRGAWKPSAPRRIVFAPQALVPASAADRARLLEAIVEAARRHPELDVTVKVRGSSQEAQTHAEAVSYPALLATHDDVPPNLSVKDGPLDAVLEDCMGLVTVSSTAALEACAAGVPVLCVDDFGVSESLINEVFRDSGLLGPMAGIAALDFRAHDPEWGRQNYLHGSEDVDWIGTVTALVNSDLAPIVSRRDRWSARAARARAIALGDADVGWRKVMYRARHALRRG